MPAKNLQRVAEGGICCHVYNKGIENRIIFADDSDYQVFLGFLEEYLSAPSSNESKKAEFTVKGRVYRGIPHQPKNYLNKVELIAYNLKPNHFHLLLHQKTKKSLQAFIRSLCTRYSMYFNKKYNRTGALFDGPYKSIQIENEKGQTLLTRYLHEAGGYSTYPEYSGQRNTPWVKTKIVLSTSSSDDNQKEYNKNYELNQEEKKLLEEITIEKPSGHLERRDLKVVSLKPWSRVPELLVASVVFIILLGFSLSNITAVAKSTQVSPVTLGTKTISTAPIATPQSKTTLTVKNTNPTVPINIESRPTVGSEKIGEARHGDIFEFVSKNSSWYEVKLPNGLTGFIPSTHVEEGATKN